MIRSCYIKVEEDTSCSGQVGVLSRVEWMSEGKHTAALIVMSQGRGLGPGSALSAPIIAAADGRSAATKTTQDL